MILGYKYHIKTKYFLVKGYVQIYLTKKAFKQLIYYKQNEIWYMTGPRSAVGNVSGNSLTADPGVVSSIPARSHTFVEIDDEIISTVILLPLAESFKKGCCQLQVKVCARSTG